MAERKENRNALRSRRLIRQAFLELIQEKEFEKITVTDIVRRADLNRSTFYAHYPDIRGVVEEIEEDIFLKNIRLFEATDLQALLRDPVPFLTSLSNVLGENIELFKRLGHTEHLHRRLDEFRRIIVEDIRKHPDVPADYRASADFSVTMHFFIGGIMNTYQQWAEGALDCSLEDITQEIARLIKASASDYIVE